MSPLDSQEVDSEGANELRAPQGYQAVFSYPRFTVQAVDDGYSLVGRPFTFTSEGAARQYIQDQRAQGFRGTVSLRQEPEANVSDPIERIDCA